MTIKYNDGNYELNEAYRSIRTFISVDERLKTILITSTEMDEGKSTSAANIARCFSELEDKKTIVIDCDFRTKSLNDQFDINRGSAGISNIVYNEKTLDECIKTEGKLDILTCGTVNCNPSVLLEMSRTKDLINSLLVEMKTFASLDLLIKLFCICSSINLYISFFKSKNSFQTSSNLLSFLFSIE